MFSIFMNKSDEKMKTINIYTGTNEENIIAFMKKVYPKKNEESKNIIDIFDSQDENAKKLCNRENYKKSKTKKK